MQTFLPLPSYEESAAVLDYRRLGKQRIECKQILNALTNGGGWANHPATKMWRGYEQSLLHYGVAICNEWRDRGYKDQQLGWFLGRLQDHLGHQLPPWLGNEGFHASHRSNLLRKDPEHYGLFGWTEPDDLPYVWPV